MAAAKTVARLTDLDPFGALLAPGPNSLFHHVAAIAVARPGFGGGRSRSHSERRRKHSHRKKVLHDHLLISLSAASGSVASALCVSMRGTPRIAALRRGARRFFCV